MKTILISFCILISGIFVVKQLNAQEYKISVNFLNCNDSVAWLAHYFDGEIFVDDTTNLMKGRGVFSKNKNLEQGIYLIWFSDQKYFDFLVGEDQNFKIKADFEQLTETAHISGSKESQAFLAFQRFIKSQKEKSSKILKHHNELEKEEPLEKLEMIDDEVRRYVNQLNEDFPSQAFVGKFARLAVSPKIPDFSKEIPANTDSAKMKEEIARKAYLYHKKHYFDHVDFRDKRLLQTPIFRNKLEIYFNQILLQNPDTIVKESVKLIEKAKLDEDFFDYMTRFALFHTMKNENIMGMDAAFVHLAEKYEMTNPENLQGDSSLAEYVQDKLARTRFNLLGMKAPDLLMQTTEDAYVRLSELDSEYTILYFWETDCGYCKEITQRLKTEIFNKYTRKKLQIFAVYTQTQKKKWKEAIENYNLHDFINCYDPDFQTNFRTLYNVYQTPILYLLNREKKIIAKRLNVNDIKIALENELKHAKE